MLKRLLIGCLIISAASNCAQKNTKPVSPPPQTRYFTHTIQHQGETLAKVAQWYTGSANNWQTILDNNPGLDPKRMRLGTQIQIPENMLVKRTQMPKPKPSEVAAVTTEGTPMDQTQGSATTDVAASEQPSDSTDAYPGIPLETAPQEEFPSLANQQPSDFGGDTDAVVQEGQQAAMEAPSESGSSSKLSRWLTGNIENEKQAAVEDSAEAAQLKPSMGVDTQGLESESAKLKQDSMDLTNKARQGGQVDAADVANIQNQAQAVQQKALEAQAQALKDAAAAVEASAQTEQKSREQLLKELTEDY